MDLKGPISQGDSEKLIHDYLARGKPILMSVRNVEYQNATGKILFNAEEKVRGHAMVLVGAKTDQNGKIVELLFENSWGNSGIGGYYSLDWADFLKIDSVDFIVQSK